MTMTSAAPRNDDAELLRASRAGEVHAFGELVERYQNLVCAVAYSRTGDRVTSEDVGQQTFLAAWNGLDNIREPGQIRSWLCSVARNLSGKAVQVRQREPSTDSEALDANASPSSDPLASMISQESEAAVWEALAELPETYREPLVLFYRENQSVKQVALGLGISEDAAKQRLSRGRQALKEGVSDLVERTLYTSRPNRAFAAGVLGALNAGAIPAVGATAGKAAGGLSTKVVWIGATLAALVVAVVAFVFATSDDIEPTTPRDAAMAADPDQQLLAHLREQREALRAQSAANPGCALDGTVTDREGNAIPDAVVSLAKNSLQANGLDPVSTRSDTAGRWSSGPLDGPEFLVSVAAPGYLAATTVRRCDAAGHLDVVLVPGGTRLRGMVGDVGGGPIEGASVWVVPTTGNPNAAVSTITNEDGTYDVSVYADRYTLLASHPDYVLAARQSVVSSDTAAEDFVLLPGASVEGVVRDSATGSPVEGARVTTLWSIQDTVRGNAPAASVFAALLPAISNADGTYRLNGLPPGPVRLTARTADLVNSEPPLVELAIAETKSDVELEIAEALTVSGFVVGRDSGNEGLAGVGVVLLSKGLQLTPNIATTDASGYYELAGVGSGEYALMIVGGGAAPQVTNDSIVVTGHNVEDLLSRADRGVSVSGRVDSTDRVSVHLEPASLGDAPLTVAALALARPELDASGGFHFPAVAAGEYVLVAKTFEGEGRLPLTVREHAVTDLQVDVDALARIEGELTGPAGNPVAGVLVVAQPRRQPKTFSVAGMLAAQDRTDEDGRYEIVGLAAGEYDLTVLDEVGQRPWPDTDAEQAFVPQPTNVTEGGTVRVDLEVQTEAAQIRGSIVGPDGEPVQDAWVRVSAQGSRRAPFGHEPRPTLTDSAGEFTLDGVFGTTFELRATGPRGKLETSATLSEVETPVSLVLAPLSTVVATVTENGLPATDFELRVSDGPTRVLGPLVEKKNGTFVLPRLQSGDYEVEVATDTGYAKMLVAVGPDPETTVELELLTRGSIRGLVLDKDGAPFGGGKVLMLELSLSLDEPRGPDGIPVADDGTFEIKGLAPGGGQILVFGPGEKPAYVGSTNFKLKPGADLDLGRIQQGKRPSLASSPFIDTSEDLGLRFFVGPRPPTSADLRAIDESDAPRDLLNTDGARLWIAEVTASSPAAQAGLLPNDAVLAVGNTKVGDEDRPPADAMISLSQSWRSKGRSVTWVVERAGARVEVPVLVAR